MADPVKHKIKLEADTQKVAIRKLTDKIGRSRDWWYSVNDSTMSLKDLMGIAAELKRPVSFFIGEGPVIKDEKDQLREMCTALTVHNAKLLDMVNRKDQELASLRKAGAASKGK